MFFNLINCIIVRIHRCSFVNTQGSSQKKNLILPLGYCELKHLFGLNSKISFVIKIMSRPTIKWQWEICKAN